MPIESDFIECLYQYLRLFTGELHGSYLTVKMRPRFSGGQVCWLAQSLLVAMLCQRSCSSLLFVILFVDDSEACHPARIGP